MLKGVTMSLGPIDESKFSTFDLVLLSKDIAPDQPTSAFLADIGGLAVSYGDETISQETILHLQKGLSNWSMNIQTVGTARTTVFTAERDFTPKIAADFDSDNYAEAGHRIVAVVDEKIKIVSKFPPKGGDILAIVGIELLEIAEGEVATVISNEQLQKVTRLLAATRSDAAKLMGVDVRDFDQLLTTAIKDAGVTRAEFFKNAYALGQINLDFLAESTDELEPTDSEITVLEHIFESNTELARTLGVKVGLAAHIRRQLIGRMGAKTPAQAYIQGLRMGIIATSA